MTSPSASLWKVRVRPEDQRRNFIRGQVGFLEKLSVRRERQIAEFGWLNSPAKTGPSIGRKLLPLRSAQQQDILATHEENGGKELRGYGIHRWTISHQNMGKMIPVHGSGFDHWLRAVDSG